MNVLVSAGNTQAPIDRVRCITNIFTGRTGGRIAVRAHERGHAVTLLTSHPEGLTELGAPPPGPRWTVLRYRTFENLEEMLAAAFAERAPDAAILSAAVSDYLSAGVFAPGPAGGPSLVDVSAGKVKSDAPELWLRLVRAPKLIDKVRTDWGFQGVLVKFKLEVGIGDQGLLEIAERSRHHSAADLMVANTLEGAATWAYLGPVGGRYNRVSRRELPDRLLDAVEESHREKSHG
jgi:phosphopantothenoylcysteine synthetase/decarboxylase